MSKVVVSCTSGAESPDNVTVSYLTAGAALDAGHDVVAGDAAMTFSY